MGDNIDDDLLVSTHSNPLPAKPRRFQPKTGKSTPKPTPEPEPTIPTPPKPEPESDAHFTSPTKNEEDSDSLPAVDASNPFHSSDVTKAVQDPLVETEAMDIDGIGGAAADADDEEEDRVVREIDVFFSPTVSDNTQLYIMQYPLRPCWRPYELNERCQEVRLDPKQSKLEVDLEINVGKGNYDKEVAERLRFQKQTLSSSNASLVTGYAVGILLGDKLHLNPVHAVVQLRPSMKYLNASQKKNNVAGSETTVNSDKGKAALKVSSEENAEDAEPWISLECHGIDSPFASKYRQNMVAEESSQMKFSMNSCDYVNSLCPGTPSGDSARGPSRRFLLTLPLEERIKRYFSEGPQVHRFNALMHLAPANSEEDVLKVLQKHACLVQGLWVAKTSLRCEGVQALARDYILLLFTANRFIRNDQLKVLKVPIELLKLVLSPLAVERSDFQDWKFKEAEDRSFIKSHPDVVEDQKQAWSNREKNIMDAMRAVGKKSTPALTKNHLKPGASNRTVPSENADQGAKGDLDGAHGSVITKMSAETREALPKALLELFRTHKVCNLQLICQGLRDMAVSKSTLPKADTRARAAIAAALGASALPELKTIIDQVAINIHGVYVLKSLGNPNVDPLRTIVINLFCGKEPNAKLKKADIVEAAKIALQREISNSEYTQVVNELCISVKGGAWMLKSGDGKPR